MSMFVRLKNGTILTEPDQLDPLLALQPAQVFAGRRDGSAVAAELVKCMGNIRQSWLAEAQQQGVTLDDIEIPVQLMFDEFANVLERAGCKFNRELITGQAAHG